MFQFLFYKIFLFANFGPKYPLTSRLPKLQDTQVSGSGAMHATYFREAYPNWTASRKFLFIALTHQVGKRGGCVGLRVCKSPWF
jgi:hypothetical protein